MEQNYTYKTLSLEQMIEYINKNAPQDKAWFKKVAMVGKEVTEKNEETGKKETKTIAVYNHFKARKAFCEKYMPYLIPVKKEKAPKKSTLLANW